MRNKKPPMNLEQHLQIAKDLKIIQQKLTDVYFQLQEHYRPTSPVLRAFRKMLPGLLNGPWPQIQSQLDDDYFRVITPEDFEKHGFIYYGLAETPNSDDTKNESKHKRVISFE